MPTSLPPGYYRPWIVILEPDRVLATQVQKHLPDDALRTAVASAPEEAVSLLEKHSADVLVAAIPNTDAATELLFRFLRGRFPGLIILGIGPNEVPFAVRAIKAGAADYVSHPIQGDKLSSAVLKVGLGQDVKSSWLACVERVLREAPEPTNPRKPSVLKHTKLLDTEEAREEQLSTRSRKPTPSTEESRPVISGEVLGGYVVERTLVARGEERLHIGHPEGGKAKVGIRTLPWWNRASFEQVQAMIQAAEMAQNAQSHHFARPEAIGAIQERRLGVLVYPLRPLTPLVQCIDSGSDLDDLEAIISQLAQTIDDCHGCGICGIRVSLETVFLSNMETVQIMDFGIPIRTRIREPYVSSTLDLERGLTPQADRHRWATFSYELLTGVPAGDSLTPIQLMRAKASRNITTASELTLSNQVGSNTPLCRLLGL